MNYRSVADLNLTINKNLHRIPADVDVVVGIPRSGLLVASIVALALNLPLADIDGFMEGKLLGSGSTRRRAALDKKFSDLRHALVLDDSVLTGNAMVEAQKKLSERSGDLKITFGAVYGTSAKLASCDLVFEVVPVPRIFEWNLMHNDVMENTCVDIDGVLCVDPTEEENDDAERYLRFLENASLLYKPTKKIGALVTSRLEKYRVPTEKWLERHHIAYDKLVMLDLPDAATRRQQGAHGTFKANYYKTSAASLFIESDLEQAEQIARLSGKHVVCFANHQVFAPDGLSPVAMMQLIRRPERMRRLVRTMVGESAWSYLKRRLKPLPRT